MGRRFTSFHVWGALQSAHKHLARAQALAEQERGGDTTASDLFAIRVEVERVAHDVAPHYAGARLFLEPPS
jgi:hypothetical protein